MSKSCPAGSPNGPPMNEAEQFRAELTPKVAQAINTAYTTGTANTWDECLPELADAAIDTVLAAFNPPF